MTMMNAARVCLALSGLADLGGAVNQVLSADKPPPVAPALGVVFGVLAVVTAVLLPGRHARVLGVAIASRVGDLLLLTGALIAGGITSETAAHQLSAGGQALVSALALCTLLLARRQRHAAAATEASVVTP